MLTLPSALLSTFEELRLLTTVKITNDKLRMTNASSCHSERSEESRLERPRRSSLRPRAVSRRSSEQDERKSGCLKRSELPDFRPVSVEKACEAHEALTFGLLWGQAKSDRKRFIADALNDKRQCNTSTIKHLNKKQSLIQACSPLIGGASFFPTLCFFYSVQ